MEMRFTFVNGPSLASVISQDDRRRIRSNVIRQGIRHQHDPKTVSSTARSPICTCKAQISASHGRKVRPNPQANSICSGCRGLRSMQGWNPASQPSASRADPFVSCAPDTGEQYHQLVDHCIQVLWPGCQLSGGYPREFYHTWVQQSGQKTFLRHALLYCASAHLNWLKAPVIDLLPEQLLHKGKALVALRQLISQPKEIHDMEDMVMAMAFLSLTCGTLSLPDTPSPFTPPLKRLQWLDYYTSRQLQPVHWNAVQMIVKQIGGIQKLRKFAVPYLLSFAALIDAAMNYKKPVYPLLNPRGQPYALHPCISIPQTSDSTSNKALGSHGFKRLLLFGIQAHLVEVFVNLGGLSQTIQSIFDGCCKSITMDIIGENRNIIQHRLLSLPTETDSPTVILDDTASEVDDLYSGLQLYYTCRQAALIYSTYVTFPVPRSAAHRDEQLMIIRNAIESSQECGEKQDASAVLLWCAFIGGIVACGSPQQAWYTEQTRNLSARNCIEDWNQLKNFLKSFAWLGAACDIGGHVLWIDMQRDE